MSVCREKGCDVVVSIQSKTGYCRKHAAGAMWRQPGFAEKQKAGWQRKIASDPEFKSKLADRARAAGKLPQAIEANRQRILEAKLWCKGNAAQPAGSPSRVKAGRRASLTKLSWCPPHLIEDYRFLTRTKKILAVEAKQMILERHKREQREWRARNGIKWSDLRVKPVPAVPHCGSGAEVPEEYIHRNKLRDEREARIEARRVNSDLCAQCGARLIVGCEHTRASSRRTTPFVQMENRA